MPSAASTNWASLPSTLGLKTLLCLFGPTLDYDIPSEITEDQQNYSDPFHLTDEAAMLIVDDIWTGFSAGAIDCRRTRVEGSMKPADSSVEQKPAFPANRRLSQ
jgi:hypothetical protein